MLNQDLISRAAEKDIPAMIKVANAYFHGEGVETDDAKAFAMFNEIVNLDPSQADVYTDIGTCWFYGYGTDVDKNKGLQYWEKARGLGSAGAFMRFGLIHRDGEMVEKNLQKAIQYFEKAIELGNTRALVELGDMYYWGEGVPADPSKAVGLFEKAANDGHIDGQHKLALAYREGKGVEKDNDKALHWFSKAAEQGGERSMVMAGLICQERGDIEQAKAFFARAMDADTADAAYLHGLICVMQENMTDVFRSFKKGYELGDADSAYRLGNCCLRGEGTAEDIPLAIESYEYAVEHGVGEAAIMLATIYGEGKGVTKDPAKQFAYMEKAYDANIPAACYYLAEYYHNGIGVEPNLEKELECLEKGVMIDKDNLIRRTCAASVGYKYYNGSGAPKDIDKAIEYWCIGADLGHAGCMMGLGQIYENAEGHIDNGKALQYYTEAAKQDVAGAYIKLGTFAHDGIAMPRDKSKALQYYIRARELGDTSAENYIIFMLAHNNFEDFDIDIKIEIEHAMPLAEDGNAEAAHVVNKLMLKDPDTSIDECNIWERLAIKGGYSLALEAYANMWVADVIQQLDSDIFLEGCNNALKNGEQLAPSVNYVLGQSYLTAQGENHNIQLAEKYLKLAADNGYVLAMRVLGSEYDNDGAFRTDIAASMRYYKMAIEADEDQYALFFLARHYLNQNDGSMAASYLRRAANGSNADIAAKSMEVLDEIERVDRENAKRQAARESNARWSEVSNSSPSSLSTQQEKSGGCYIATAVYGSYDCPEVWTLRRFRDKTLSKSIIGQVFIRTYYAVSPTIVRMFGNKPSFNAFWKRVLNYMVSELNNRGFDNTPYNDIN